MPFSQLSGKRSILGAIVHGMHLKTGTGIPIVEHWSGSGTIPGIRQIHSPVQDHNGNGLELILPPTRFFG